MQAPCWNIRSFWSLGLANSISRNLKSFLRVGSFYFSSTQSCIPKLLTARKFHFRKYKKNFFGKNVRIFFFLVLRNFFPNIWKKYEVRKFHFLRYKKSFNPAARKFRFLKYKKFFWVDFFYFFELGLEIALGSPFYITQFYLLN